MDSVVEAAEQSAKIANTDALCIPKNLGKIPQNCQHVHRPAIIRPETQDFLALLDSAVRKAPLTGISIEAACKLKGKVGKVITEQQLRILLNKHYCYHVLLIYKGMVRLSTRDLAEKAEQQRKRA